ncbi:MAG: hypothetical protein ACI9OJ_003845, partial [Myxococcota bacterium]
MAQTGGGRPQRLLLALAALLLAVPLVLVDALIEPGDAADAISVSDITIDLFADEAVVVGGTARVLRQEGRVHWRNRSGRILAVTSPNGLLDSGPIPDGGSFHASLPVAGTYDWVSDVGGGVIVVEAEFSGSSNDRVLDHIPDVAPPPRDPADIALHPELAVELSRSVAIVGFTETATVGEALQALGSSWEIVGGLPNVGLVYVKLGSPPANFATIDILIQRLRDHVAVQFASYDFLTTESVVPPPSADAE